MTMTEKANNVSVFGWTKDNNENLLLKVSHAVLLYKNFSGAETKFNPMGGKRTFNLVLSNEVAADLKELGWNVKEKAPRNPDEETMYTTEIVVKMNGKKPPHLYLCSDNNGVKNMTPLDESTMGILDYGEFKDIDLLINPWKHDKNKDYIYKGYLHTIWATQAATLDFDGKYSDYRLNNDPAAAIAPSEDDDDGELPF